MAIHNSILWIDQFYQPTDRFVLLLIIASACPRNFRIAGVTLDKLTQRSGPKTELNAKIFTITPQVLKTAVLTFRTQSSTICRNGY
jgi:hypothetical protein